MVVASHENHALQATCQESEKKVFPARRTLRLAISTPSTVTASQSMPIATSTRAGGGGGGALSGGGIHDQVGIFAVELREKWRPSSSSSFLLNPLIALALKLCPQSSSLIALTLRVDTPDCTSR